MKINLPFLVDVVYRYLYKSDQIGAYSSRNVSKYSKYVNIWLWWALASAHNGSDW